MPQLAIRAERLDLVQLLIPASDLETAPSGGSTPLHTAVQCQCEAAVQLLLQAAPGLASVPSREGFELTPLCEASANGCTAIVRLMLEAAPQAATACSYDDAIFLPIHAAANAGHAAVVQLLLAAAPQTATAVTGEAGPWDAPPESTPLHLAAAHGDISTLQLLLASTAPTAALAMDGYQRLPAYCAIASRNVAALVALLQAAPAAASTWDGDGQVTVRLSHGRDACYARTSFSACLPSCCNQTPRQPP